MAGGRRAGHWAPLGLLIVIAGLPFAVHSRYYQSIAVIIGFHTIVAVGLSLLMGYAGQVSLGHAAFYGLGAYASAIASTRLGLDPWVAMPLAAVLTGGLAAAIGTPIFRLRGHFLAMATLGWGIIVSIVFNELREVTGGPSGLTGIPNLALFGLPLDTDARYYYLVWAVCLGILFLSQNIVRSRTGRALRAIHASEEAALSVGVDVAHYKVKVFALSAVYASIAGSLYAHYVTFVSPQPFGFMFSVKLVVMAVVGGLASIWGAIFGAAGITLLGESLHELGQLDVVVFGLILMVVVITLPQGLTRGILDLVDWAAARLKLEGRK